MLSELSLKKFLKWIYPFIILLSRISRFFSSFRISIFHSFPKPLRVASLILFILISATSTWFYFNILKDLPSPSTLASQPISLTTHIRDRNGQELYKIYAQQNRTLVKLSDLPEFIPQAVISIEDKDFYHHAGFSLSGTLRAAWRILTNQSFEGGSTLTQQLVKTSLLTPERTLQRKIRELVLSLIVERLYTKDQILEMYLNRISFGGSAYGIEEAAQTYFGKPAHQLTLSQATLLAGLPASPTTYSPYGAHPELAKSRQKEVLRLMVSNGYISWEEAESASNTELIFKAPVANILAPHFVMYIKSLLEQEYGPDIVERGGLDVTTSLDLNYQQIAEKIVASEVAKVEYLHITNGAAIITQPTTGEILAMVGSRDYFDLENDGNVNVTTSLRQPGSSIKPINYALALSRGFTAASIIDDSPITYRSPGEPDYSPVNYDNRFHGKVTLRSALANSYNVPAVKVLSANGVNNMIDLAEKMGIASWKDRSRFGLSLTLGGGEVSMLDMAVAYGVFANSGKRVNLHPILSVRDSQGKLLKEFRCPQALSLIPKVSAAEPINAFATEITSCPSEDVLDPKIAFLISDILSDNAARTPTFGPHSDLYFSDHQVAVKTGTTNSLRDNWTIGYTPTLLTAVWVGNNDNSPMSYVASGVTGASPIWHKIMAELLKQAPQLTFSPPSGITSVTVCTTTGKLPCGNCPTKSEYFIQGTEPNESYCPPSPTPEVFSPPPTPTPKRKSPRDKLLEGIQTSNP